MTKQEEIRGEIHDIIGDCLIKIGCGGGGCPKAEIVAEEAQEDCIQSLLKYLHSQGVALKVEGELPMVSFENSVEGVARFELQTKTQRDMLKAGYTQTELL